MRTRAWKKVTSMFAVMMLSSVTPAWPQPPQVFVNFSAEGGQPYAKLLQGSDGNLYGTTCRGGTRGQGSVFMLAPDGRVETLHSFIGTDGECPRAELIESHGFLYGTTSNLGPDPNAHVGTIFRIALDPGSPIQMLHAFSLYTPAGGSIPIAGLVELGGFFYGTTQNGGEFGAGTIFKMDVSVNPARVTVVHAFRQATRGNGAFPAATLLAVDGYLYGTTPRGGAGDKGTLFRFDPNTNDFTVAHDFADGGGISPYAPLITVGDYLYGVTQFGGGGIYRLRRSDGNFDGSLVSVGFGVPTGSLLLATDGALYGTAETGGDNGDGVVFRVELSDPPVVSARHHFNRNTSGSSPKAGLIEVQDTLYGTAVSGGAGGQGTVFAVGLGTGPTSANVLHRFGPVPPNVPLAELTFANGAFYGTTSGGGQTNGGTVFTWDGISPAVAIVHDFDSTRSIDDGTWPTSALIDGGDGLYGTTRLGGEAAIVTRAGTVFKTSFDGQHNVLYTFNSEEPTPQGSEPSGAQPNAKLLRIANYLYGTTYEGGLYRDGTVFRIRNDGADFMRLHSFNALDPLNGSFPTAPLVLGSHDGFLYGTTSSGGPYDGGTVFKISQDGSSFRVIHPFDPADSLNGAYPSSALVEGEPGVFYGTAPGDGFSTGGIVFRLDATTDPAGFTTIRSFDPCCSPSSSAFGSSPVAALVKGAGGWYYGTTFSEGPTGFGTAFAIDRSGNIGLIATFDGTHGANPTSALTLMADGSFYGTTSAGGSFGRGTIFRIAVDSDRDGVLDGIDNCPVHANANQADSNGDGTGDACTGPVADLTPASLDFGDVAIGSVSAARLVSLRNAGASPLSVGSITTTTTAFSAVHACPESLAPGAGCAIEVRFAPLSNGSQQANLQIEDSAAGSPHRVSLSGRGRGVPAVDITPGVLTFENQLVGTSSAAKDVTVTNTGNDDLAITAFVITTGHFYTTRVCPSILAPSASCTISVAYGPTTTGYHEAQLQITDNAAGSPRSVRLIGYGDARSLSITPPFLNFGRTPVDATTAQQRVTVTNTGTLPVGLTAVSLDAGTTAGTVTAFAGTTISGSGADDIPAALAQLNFPTSLAFDMASNLFFVDRSSGRVRRIDAATRTIRTIWTPGFDIPPANNVAVDRHGNLFVGTQTRVYKIDEATGAISLIAGSGILGSSGDGGPATAATFGENGLAIDARGNVFIADVLSSTVRRVDSVSNIITRVAGTGVFGYSGDAGPATEASLNSVLALAIDAAGNLFIRENPSGSNPNGIRRVDVRTGVIESFAAPFDSIDGGPELALDSQGNLFAISVGRIVRLDIATGVVSSWNPPEGFSNVTAMAVDQGGNVYVAESFRNLIWRLDAATTTSFTSASDCGAVLDVGGACHIDVSFTPRNAGPHNGAVVIRADDAPVPHTVGLAGLAVRPLAYFSPRTLDFGLLAIALTRSQEAIVANSGNAPLDLVGLRHTGTASSDFTISAGTCPGVLDPATNCPLQVSFAPTASGVRSAIVSVNNGGSGEMVLVGTGLTVTLDVTPLALSFSNQSVGTASAAQRILITNTGTADVTLDLSATLVSGSHAQDFRASSSCPTVLVPAVQCSIDVVFQPSAAGLRTAMLVINDNAAGSPHQVALSGTGTTGTALISVSPSRLDFGNAPLNGAPLQQVVRLTNTGAVPATLSSVQLVGSTTTAGWLRTIAGGGVSGQPDEGGAALAADLGDVFDTKIDRDGNVYLSDATHHRVRRIDAVTGIITTVAGTGARGYSGDGGAASAARLDNPTGLAIDRNGALYIADTGNHVVRRVDAAGTITTIAGIGNDGYNGDGGPATHAALNAPIGLAVDYAGVLFIADSQNHAIRRIDSSGSISTVAGNGSPGSGLGTEGTPLTLHAPAAVAVDAAGRLYIADTGNNRVARLERDGEVTWLILGVSPPIHEPAGIAVDAFGHIFVADTLQHRIRRLDPADAPRPVSSAEATWYYPIVTGTGTAGFADTTFAFPGQLAFPRGLAVDVAGNVYVADQGNHRVRRLDATTTDTTTEFSAVGTCGDTLDPGASCDIGVAFSPRSPERRVGSLLINGETVPLGGVGTLPIAFVDARDAAILKSDWMTEIGLTSTRQLEVFNSGNGVLHVNDLVVTYHTAPRGVFLVTPSCGDRIEPADVCRIDATFAPTVVDFAAATLRIVHDGPMSPLTLDLAARGTRAPTQTVVSTAQARSSYGENVRFAIQVSSRWGTPGGSVVVSEASTVLATLPLSGGSTEFVTSTLAATTHALSVRYDGDTEHLPSSFALTFLVDRQTTETTLTSNVSSAVYGQPITFTATVLPMSSGPLTGAVRFQDGARTLGKVAISGRIATLLVSDLDIGPHSVIATYEDDPNAVGSSAPPRAIVVVQATTTTAVSFSSTSVYVDRPVTITATVSPQFGGVPTGTATFYNQNTVIGTMPLTAGTASLTTSFRPTQTAQIRARYSGDARFTASTSGTKSLLVQRAPTTVQVTSSINPSTYGQAVTFTATVSSPIGPPPDGEIVRFSAGGQSLSGVLNGGVARATTTSSLPGGNVSVIASYLGNIQFLNSTSPIYTQIVKPAPTTVVLISSQNPSPARTSVTFTVTVTSAAGVPNGSVMLRVNDKAIKSAALINGTTSFSHTFGSPGTYTVSVLYNGTTNYERRSATLSQFVQ